MFPYKKTTIDCGFAFVNNVESSNLNFNAGCFLWGRGFWAMGAWFLNDSISCPTQLSLKITFIV